MIPSQFRPREDRTIPPTLREPSALVTDPLVDAFAAWVIEGYLTSLDGADSPVSTARGVLDALARHDLLLIEADDLLPPGPAIRDVVVRNGRL